ncbi:hypothetical protein BDD12DRAFT_835609 [Trichophaea hybrida]|nr:hypothetical protein BDD12DRAFT_835609 [Trichophaea hybrida]
MKVEGAFLAVYFGLTPRISCLWLWTSGVCFGPTNISTSPARYCSCIRTRILRLIMYTLAGHTNGPAMVHICAPAYKKLPQPGLYYLR